MNKTKLILGITTAAIAMFLAVPVLACGSGHSKACHHCKKCHCGQHKDCHCAKAKS